MIMKIVKALGPILAALLIAACSADAEKGKPRIDPAAAPGATAPVETAPDRQRLPKIVILGDSLTAGLGLPIDESYPSLLQRQLDSEGLRYEVVNAGVSGDTSAGGLR